MTALGEKKFTGIHCWRGSKADITLKL